MSSTPSIKLTTCRENLAKANVLTFRPHLLPAMSTMASIPRTKNQAVAGAAYDDLAIQSMHLRGAS